MKFKQFTNRLVFIAPFLLITNSSIAQDYVPSYLTTDNEFISENFDVIDSSGWFQALPETDISFSSFLTDYMQYFGMGADDGFVIKRATYMMTILLWQRSKG